MRDFEFQQVIEIRKEELAKKTDDQLVFLALCFLLERVTDPTSKVSAKLFALVEVMEEREYR